MDGKAELGAIVKSKPTVSELRRRRAIAGTFCRNSRVSPASRTFEAGKANHDLAVEIVAAELGLGLDKRLQCNVKRSSLRSIERQRCSQFAVLDDNLRNKRNMKLN